MAVKKLISLTFDDGPNLIVTPLVLDLLEQYNVSGAFFLVGNNINAQTSKIVKRAFDMGCDICSHSKTHSVMPDLTDEEIISEIEFTDKKIKEITGENSKFFRPPYIAVNERMYRLIQKPFICGIGCEDWKDEVSALDRVNAVVNGAESGQIILLHDSRNNCKTAEALKRIIPALLDKAYELVNLTTLFNETNTDTSQNFGRLYTIL